MAKASKAVAQHGSIEKPLSKFLQPPPYYDVYNSVTKNNITEFNRIIPIESLIYKKPNRVNAV